MATIFESIAVQAYEILVKEKQTNTPLGAWRMAAPAFTSNKNSQEKPCPIDAFCGLWYSGKIKNSVPWRNYRLVPSACHAIDGIEELKKNPNLSKLEVWSRIPGTNGGKKTRNGEMDVLFALWKAGLIVGQPLRP